MREAFYEPEADESGYIHLLRTDNNNTPAHFHNSVELAFVVRGDFRARGGGEEAELHAGDIFCAEAYVTHLYASDEDARVYVHNTVPEATIDLSVGLVTKDAYASAETIEAKKEETGKYAAIVVPQRLDNQVPLIEIVVEGVSYMVERKFVFKQGIQHTVNVTLAKNPDQVKIEIGGEIEDWD